MDNLPSANRALLSYISSLLSDSVAMIVEGNADNSPNENRGRGERNMDNDANSAPEQDYLSVILIKAGDIPLAIPIDDIKEIVAAESKSLRYYESAKGENVVLLNHDGINIRVLDLKDIILPGRHTSGTGMTDEKDICVLVLESGAYGLICDAVLESIRLSRQEVEWRSHRNSRPWLQGMVKEHNHALLDVKEIIRAFISNSKIPH